MHDHFQQKLAEHCDKQTLSLTPLNGGADLIMDPHQQDAMELAAIALMVNEKSFSIVHSCGSGKTIIEANLAIASQRAKEELGINDTQDLLVTTERSLIHSIRNEFESLGLDTGIWGMGKKILDRPLVIADIQALQTNRKIINHLLPSERIKLLLGDEADVYLTKKRKETINQFQNAVKIGMTATGTWPDGRDISEIWGEKIHEMRLKDGIINGVNVPPLFYLFEANLDDSRLKIEHGDYEKKELQAALKEAEIQKAIPEVYKALIPKDKRKNYPTLVYVPSVQLAHAVEQELLNKFGSEKISVKCWTGDQTTSQQIQNDLSDFNNGKVDILVLCEMGGRGINLPRARCLIDAYPTLSPTKLEQRHGRVLRKLRNDNRNIPSDGFEKHFALIAQIIPKSNRYRPYLLPDLLDCWPDFKNGRLLGKAVTNAHYNGGDVGAPIQNEVAMLRQHLLKNKPKIFVNEINRIDIYEQLNLRDKLPQANDEGFIEIKKGERYGTLPSWAIELGISSTTIQKRLEGEEGILGKLKGGQLHKFYLEKLVREKCADLLTEMPKADDEGYIEINKGERYGTINLWAKELGISEGSIKRRLEGEEGIIGKLKGGQLNKFYLEKLVREKCANLLSEMPKADDEGFIEINKGERYGIIPSWAKEFGISPITIKKRLKGEEGIIGKHKDGNLYQFYLEKLVREKCANLLSEMPKVNDEGFIEIKKGERYGTIKKWEKELGISSNTIQRRLEGEEGILGKHKDGNLHQFYLEKLVRKKCADLITEMPKADDEGFIEIKKGERYGTIPSWAKEFGISKDSIKRRLEGEEGILGKIKNGHLYKFYLEKLVREKCADFMTEVPKANDEGFIETKKGERYGTINLWEKELGISEGSIKKRLKGEEVIIGKPKSGKLSKFYLEKLVREKCADLMTEVAKADNEGFIEINKGERSGTISSWTNELGISEAEIRRRLKGEESIIGKLKDGKLSKFYLEKLVREKCADLITEIPKANDEGFIEINNGERYGTIKKWEIELGISVRTIKKRLEGEEGIIGKVKGGQIYQFYLEKLVREKCADLLAKK